MASMGWTRCSAGAVVLRKPGKTPRILRFGRPTGPFFVWIVGRRPAGPAPTVRS
ncbi:MAG: hypothetical protein HY748_12135 [Elusimicrobia bacterium]|nr:hypothetical protein [Elusimicrobiota bacterium]